MMLEHQRRRRVGLRRMSLALGLLLIAAGYWSLSVDPGVTVDVATRRAFVGMGLVIAGTVMSLLSRWI